MKKILALALSLVLVFSFPAKVFAHWDIAYWNYSYPCHTFSDWMAGLSQDLKLNRVSIPGTHNTMAYNSNLTDIVRCQGMTLSNQLLSGIRFLDIRLSRGGSTFYVHHGSVYTGYKYTDVMNTVTNFLREHPNEFVIMRLQEENTKEAAATVWPHYNAAMEPYRSFIYQGGESNPSVRDLRGKIFNVFSGGDHFSRNALYMDYYYCEDTYNVANNWRIYDKWLLVKNSINNANNSKSGGYLTFLNASGGCFPYFAASGHWEPHTNAPRLWTGAFWGYPDWPRQGLAVFYEGMNTMAADLIARKSYTGIVVADFAGERLIKNIINANFAPRFTNR